MLRKFKPQPSDYVQDLVNASKRPTAASNSKYATTPLAQKIKAAKARFKPSEQPCLYWQDKQKEQEQDG